MTAVLSSDGKTLRFNAREFSSGKSAGRDLPAGMVIKPAKNSWREIRR